MFVNLYSATPGQNDDGVIKMASHFIFSTLTDDEDEELEVFNILEI